MGFLGTPLGWIMYSIESFIGNYGISLILFVLITKIALLPLSIKQQKTMGKTAAISPKLKVLQKQYGNNKQKYNEEMMKLYEEEGVNPMGGCLPMLVQFALLFGIIDVIYKPLKHLLRVPKDMIDAAIKVVGQTAGSEISVMNAVQKDPAKFAQIFEGGWLEKIQNFDMTFFGINLGDVPPLAWSWLLLIPILSGLTAFIMSHFSMRQQEKMGQQMQGMMKGMMYFTPLMSVWFGFTLPTGVGIYWIVSNIFAIVQTVLLYKYFSPERLATLSGKDVEKNREKMRIKREKLEEYNKRLIAQGKQPMSMTAKEIKKEKELTPLLDRESAQKEKEIQKNKISEARKRMAEKYGEDYGE